MRNPMYFDSTRKHYIKVFLLAALAWLVAYELVGELAARLQTIDLTMAVDRKIPLIPGFVWIYAFCYLFPLVPIFVTRDWHRFNRGLLAMAIANIAAFTVYLVFPVAIPRAELGNSVSERMLAFIYWLDFEPAVTELPSLHVFFAWLIFLMSRRQLLNRFGDAVLFSIALGITVSTLLVKQHFVFDVVAGLVWAAGSWRLAGVLYARLAPAGANAPIALRQTFARLSPATLLAALWLPRERSGD
jgi:membrane-associated phospholipid phosphatase